VKETDVPPVPVKCPHCDHTTPYIPGKMIFWVGHHIAAVHGEIRALYVKP
jgi:hypothetical protein